MASESPDVPESRGLECRESHQEEWLVLAANNTALIASRRPLNLSHPRRCRNEFGTPLLGGTLTRLEPPLCPREHALNDGRFRSRAR